MKPFARLKAARAKVEAVTTDLSAARIQAVGDHAGGVVRVFDHFHAIKLLNEKRSDFRREGAGALSPTHVAPSAADCHDGISDGDKEFKRITFAAAFSCLDK